MASLAGVPAALTFPGEDSPDYRDFAYFLFVIGMICQVSYVQVTHEKCAVASFNTAS
jgi:uncharacterized membrane protein